LRRERVCGVHLLKITDQQPQTQQIFREVTARSPSMPFGVDWKQQDFLTQVKLGHELPADLDRNQRSQFGKAAAVKKST